MEFKLTKACEVGSGKNITPKEDPEAVKRMELLQNSTGCGKLHEEFSSD